MKIHIKGGRVIDPKHGIDRVQDVFVAAGKIVSIGEAPAAADTAGMRCWERSVTPSESRQCRRATRDGWRSTC